MQTSELIKQLDIALGMRKAGDYVDALGTFEFLEKQSANPQDIAVLRFFQATCLTDLGRPEEAQKRISEVDQGRLVFSQQADYEYERARIERSLGRPTRALSIVEKALKMIADTNSKQEVLIVLGNLSTLRGILLAENGKCDEAIPILEAVPVQDEGWAEAKLHEGDCKYKNKLYQEAIVCYQSLISSTKDIHPFHRDAALRNIGYAHYDSGQYKTAIEYLKRVEHAYDEDPDMKAELFGILASSYSRLGMTQEAVRYGGFSRGTGSVQ